MDVRNIGEKFDAIVCLSQIDWDFLWQRTQEIMSQFAKMGYPVLFIENTGARAPGLKDTARILSRLKNALQIKKVVKDKRSDRLSSSIKACKWGKTGSVNVYSPLALPFPYTPAAVKFNYRLLHKKIIRFSTEIGIPINRILIWSYMTTPLAVEISGSLPWAGVVVDLVSDPCKVPGTRGIVLSHRKMLERASTVLCASVPTVNTVKQYITEGFHSKVYLVEDGFSTDLPELVLNNTSELQPFLNSVTGKTVAYIGGINDKIWWEAISDMTSNFPEINFIFAGPKDYDSFPCSHANNNVQWLPAFEEYVQLGIFLDRCAVGLIPYKLTPFVSEMRPAKINEYLVMGLPIVATKLPELERFSLECGRGVMYLADTPADFVCKLRQALDEDCEELRTKRRDITLSRSWAKVCEEIETCLQGVI